jgi:hypothetical protein
MKGKEKLILKENRHIDTTPDESPIAAVTDSGVVI